MERKTIGIDLGHCETTAAYPRQTATYSNILDNTLSTALEIVTLKRFGVEEENA